MEVDCKNLENSKLLGKNSSIQEVRVSRVKGAVKGNFFIDSKWSAMLQNHDRFGLFSYPNIFLQKMGVFLLPKVEKFQP